MITADANCLAVGIEHGLLLSHEGPVEVLDDAVRLVSIWNDELFVPSGTVVPQEEVTFTTLRSVGGEESAVKLAFDTTASAPSLPAVAGAYVMKSSMTPVPGALSISAQGKVSGEQAGCRVNGSIAPAPSGEPYYQLSLTSGDGPCSRPGLATGRLFVSGATLFVSMRGSPEPSRWKAAALLTKY